MVDITDNLCTKQENSSIKSGVGYNGTCTVICLKEIRKVKSKLQPKLKSNTMYPATSISERRTEERGQEGGKILLW